jgi:hypothetical protein
MLSFEDCEKKLNSEIRTYSDPEIELIRQILWKMAQNEYEQYFRSEQNEKSGIDGEGVLG